LTGDKMEQLMAQLVESPLFAAFMVFGIESKYFNNSGLTDQEKEAGKITLARFINGLTQKEIDEGAIDEVLAHIGERQDGGGWKLREQATDQELRDLLATAKTKADEAEIPEEVEEFDPSDELKLIIDQALAAPVADEQTD
jgi:hypothetical protein